MKLDADASLRCWGVAVALAGRSYVIPPLPAGPWLVAINGPYRLIVPGMVAGLDADDLLDLMVSGQVRMADIERAAREAITEVSGTNWWSATRLVAWLRGNWGTLGSAVLARGIDPTRAPLGAMLAVTYRVVLESCKDEQERGRVDMELDRPPEGVPIDEMYDERLAASAFMALAARDGG